MPADIQLLGPTNKQFSFMPTAIFSVLSKDLLTLGKVRRGPLPQQSRRIPVLACSGWPAGNAHHGDPQGLPGTCAAELSSSVPRSQRLLGKTAPLEPGHGGRMLKEREELQLSPDKSHQAGHI